MNERDLNSLKNMLMFAERINNRIANISLEQFLDNEEKQDLILYPLGQLGENANRASEELREKYHEILWNPIISIRNRIFHSYEDINMSIVYQAAIDHIPVLIKQLKNILIQNKIMSISSVENAKKMFGVTNDIAKAGYLLLTGEFLDFDGTDSDGYAWGHNHVCRVYDYEIDPGDSIMVFVNEGNIRLSLDGHGFKLSKRPNKDQISALRSYVNYYRGEIAFDLHDEDGKLIFSMTYPQKTASSKVISDIINYFDSGIIPNKAARREINGEWINPS